MLGTLADPRTSLAFASDANHCFNTRLPVPISTIHQDNYCLSAAYERCPVYQSHGTTGVGGALLPLAAVDVSPSEWAEPATPVIPAVAVAAAASATPSTALPAPSPVLNWEQPIHPDFEADLQSAAARPPAQRVNGRVVLLALLLLLLIPLGWWLWSSRGDARGAAPPGGVSVTLPTLAATAAGEEISAVIPPPATATATATEESSADGAAAPPATSTPEPTASDLENVAATATALFAGATAVTECVPPGWWVEYAVEAGDTLEGLAEARGVRPEELIVANCLAGPELPVGLVLWLPPVGVIVIGPGQTLTPTRPAANPTARPTGLPILFPTPTFPVVIIPTAAQPTFESPTDEPPTRPPARPTNPPAATPTATAPNPFPTPANPTATPPSAVTLTPPGVDPTATVTPTRTPPSVP
jgi:hypothetical protein